MTAIAANSTMKTIQRTLPAAEQKLDLETLNAMFETQDPTKIVEWAANQFGDELVMTSSFGAESALLIHMATQVAPRIRIIVVDTGYLFPETHRFIEEMRLKFDLNVWIYRTKNDPIAYLQQAGEDNPTWRKDDKACCAANKNEPLERAMREIAPRAYLRGIRGDQTKERAGAKHVEWYARYNSYAISPILRWTTQEIYAYMKRHALPFHPLYYKGYPSIGCSPTSCTRPIMPGEDPRAGRWAGQGKFECGINIANSLDSANL